MVIMTTRDLQKTGLNNIFLRLESEGATQTEVVDEVLY